MAHISGEIVLIRHAPAATAGRLCGRVDVPLRGGDETEMARLASTLAAVPQDAGFRVVASPALRCRQTAQALFPAAELSWDARLWEQDFGDEDGVALGALPDLGPMSRDALARRRPPGGESFADMVARATPALEAAANEARSGARIAIVAHAGTVRAGLALALGSVPAALAFEVAPLSVTRLRVFADGWSIMSVNGTV